MILTRNFFNEIDDLKFIPITYTIFNKLEEDYFISFLEKKYNEKFSVNDFLYYDFDLSDKEKFLLKMHNKEYLNNLILLKNKIKNNNDIKLYVDYDNGIIRIVKLKF